MSPTLLLVLLMLPFAALACAGSSASPGSSESSSARLLIKFKPGTSPDAARALLQMHGALTAAPLQAAPTASSSPIDRWWVATFSSTEPLERTGAALRVESAIEAVEPDVIIRVPHARQ